MVAFVQPKGQLQSIGCVHSCGCKARGDRKTMVAFVCPIVQRMVAKQGAASKDCRSSDRLFVRGNDRLFGKAAKASKKIVSLSSIERSNYVDKNSFWVLFILQLKRTLLLVSSLFRL